MKNNKYQILRGLCVICVILIHTLYFTNNIYINSMNVVIRRIIDFAVAIFIFMSGYFIKCDNGSSLKNFYLKKLKRIVFPLVIWNIIYTMIKITTGTFSILSILKMLIFGTSSAHLYYLYVLIQLYLLTPIIIIFIDKYKDNRFILYFPLFITLLYNTIVVLTSVILSVSIPMYQYICLAWFSYYYLGIIMKQGYMQIKNIYVIKITNIVSIFVSVLCGLLILQKYDMYNLAISQVTVMNYFYCISLCIILNQKNIEINNSVKSFFVQVGNYSYGIYLSHMLVLKLIKEFFVHNNYMINVLSIFLFTFLITYILNKIYYQVIRVKLDEKN